MGLIVKFNACVVLAVLAFAAVVQTGSALHCYSCTGGSDGSSCGDPFNATEHNRNMRTANCDASDSQNFYGFDTRHVCKKIVQKNNGYREVKRLCAIADHEEVDITNGPCSSNVATPSNIVVESCHICNTDYCNGASSISATQIFQSCGIAFATFAVSPFARSFF